MDYFLLLCFAGLHWVATFLDPTFKNFNFLPVKTNADMRFKRNLLADLDQWLLVEMTSAARKLETSTMQRYRRTVYTIYYILHI